MEKQDVTQACVGEQVSAYTNSEWHHSVSRELWVTWAPMSQAYQKGNLPFSVGIYVNLFHIQLSNSECRTGLWSRVPAVEILQQKQLIPAAKVTDGIKAEPPNVM